MTDDLYREIILDHDRSPRNFRNVGKSTPLFCVDNPICGDRYTLYIHVENGCIREIAFHGMGCAVSKASISIMSEVLRGRSMVEAEALYTALRNALTGNDLTQSLPSDELMALASMRDAPARRKCALLGWETLDDVATQEAG